METCKTFTGRSHQPGQRGGIVLWLLVLLLLAGLGGIIYAARRPLLRAFAAWWVVDERLEKSQAIVVLGGDSVLGDRVRHAVELYRRGWAPRVILSGSPLRTYYSETELMEREAANLGLPPDALLVFRHNAYSTLHEAMALRRFLAEHNLRRIIVVTSNLHTRRARTIFHAVLRRHGTQVRFSAAPDVRFPPGRWWEEREARAALFMELVKTVHTWWELRDLPAQAGLPPPASAPEAPPAGALLPIAPPLPAAD